MSMLTIENIEDDEEYLLFRDWVATEDKSKATAKSYLANFRRLRNIIGKEIQHTAQDTLIKAVEAEIENKNTQSAVINVAILVRDRVFGMPTEALEKKRQDNKGTIQEGLKMTNKYIILPSITEFDDYISKLFRERKYMEFIVNYLIRHCFVRNQDMIFEFIETHKEAEDTTKNYMLYERKKKQVTYIRNVYKTANTYGAKENVITDPDFITALRAMKDRFPIIDSESKIGYYVQKYSFQELGEGALLKIIINEYRGNINVLKRISESRGTNLPTLLTSYNITYTNE
jgi:hypothetical protein